MSLTFDLNGGNVSGDTDDVVDLTAIVGDVLLDNANTPTPILTDYTLSGWAYNEDGSSVVGAGDLITYNDTVYAIWVLTT